MAGVRHGAGSGLLLGDRRFRRRIGNGIAKGGLVVGREVRERGLLLLAPLLHLFFRGGRFLGVEAAVARHVEGLRWEGKAGAGTADDFHNVQEQVLADGGEFAIVAGEDVAEDLQAQAARIKTGEADARAVGFDFRMLV